ncbi:MAG: hypothetical protein JWQ66_1152 [Mucilaginibacter sp.]|nr:hypothetical protein [Mucilaginibacter sp.]
MDDQLDNDLKKRIREVFDNFEDTDADEGWLLLREKYPEKEKRRPVAWLWWGSVAAALLLFFLGILWLRDTPENKQKLAAGKQHPVSQAPKTIETKKDNSVKDNSKADSVINSLQNQNLTDNTSRSDLSHKNAPPRSTQQPLVPSISNQQNSKQNNSVAVSNIPKNDNTSKELAAVNQPKTQDQHVTANNAANNSKLDTVSKQPAKSMAAVTVPGGVNMQEQVKKANKTLFAEDAVADNKKSEKTQHTDKAVRFGIYAATYFNYAKGSNSQLNVGAGVTSDIKLSRNLGLSTGLSIAQNTLSYSSQVPNGPQLEATPAVAVGAQYLAASQNIYSAATPSLKNYNANLVGLDIPLNLKYEFNPEKSSTYVSLGLSSGTFINETYTATYNYTVPYVNSISQTTDQSTHQSFNSFYFAKTLNFSFGTGYSLGPNRLIIEPFLKYPLEGLGSQQIKFGAGGLNLKFNFQTQKK